MGQLIHVHVDIKAVDRFIKSTRRQGKFVAALIATYSAQDGANYARRNVANRFELRRKWVPKGIRFTKAKKSDGTAYVGTRDYYMALQEFGGRRKARDSKFLAVPVDVRPNPSKNLTKGKRPEALMDGKKFRGAQAYMIPIRKGNMGIFARVGRTGKKKPVLLYHLRRQPMKVKERPWLFESVDAAVKANLRKNVTRAMQKAEETAF